MTSEDSRNYHENEFSQLVDYLVFFSCYGVIILGFRWEEP